MSSGGAKVPPGRWPSRSRASGPGPHKWLRPHLGGMAGRAGGKGESGPMIPPLPPKRREHRAPNEWAPLRYLSLTVMEGGRRGSSPIRGLILAAQQAAYGALNSKQGKPYRATALRLSATHSHKSAPGVDWQRTGPHWEWGGHRALRQPPFSVQNSAFTAPSIFSIQYSEYSKPFFRG